MMYAVVHIPTNEVLLHNGLFDDKRKAKLSMRNNTHSRWQNEYGIAEVKVLINKKSIEVVNPESNKWEKVNR